MLDVKSDALYIDNATYRAINMALHNIKTNNAHTYFEVFEYAKWISTGFIFIVTMQFHIEFEKVIKYRKI